MGTASPNFDSGYGFVQADAAFALIPKAAPPPPAPPPAKSGGGGGGIDVLALLGLAAAGMARVLRFRRRVLI
jgi:hypothetical protein